MKDARELLLAAHLMARPDFLTVLALDLGSIQNETVKNVLRVLSEEGPAFATPSAMLQALQDLPTKSDYDTLQKIFVSQPDPDEVDLPSLLELKEEVERASIDRAFIEEVQRQIAYITCGDTTEEVAHRLERAIMAYREAKFGQDHTAPSILSRLKQAPPKIRWQSGIEHFDRAFPGLASNGQPGYGMLAQKEVTVLAAQYKAGKTREVLNWAGCLLDQGASVTLVVLEDDEGSYALKLMAAKYRIPKYILERYLAGGIGFLGDDRKELANRCDAAIAWFNEVKQRLRIYDATSSYNIFKFPQALSLLTLDKALYKTTHVIIDYVQAWGGEYKDMAGYAFGLRAFAAKHDVSIIEISQFANETIKIGSQYGQLAAKGAGEWAQAAHVGIELMIHPEVGDREFALALKIARDAPKLTVYAQYDVKTGTVLRYSNTPQYFPLSADKIKSASRF